ncbi:MAG TPA: patatin-like phospholipase family protein [Bryobacteraceae bacterium]|nr:patatin-like phospholipase family protein [Bryobacteraceae bacterium]
MKFVVYILLLASLWVHPPLSLLAQSPATRPTIGVALEGGGALGLAHIGVLEWLEDHQIPVDYIAGTSMGGLVGGMYAMGMRPKDIRKLIRGVDWNETLAGQTPFQALSYRRKQDRRTFQNKLEFGLRGGFSVPGGLTSGQNVTLLIDRESLPYSNLKSFDELPIPFRCIGADLVSGKAHVFDDGPLGEALRATMSLPAVFNPVKADRTIYADGGLLDNLPVDVVRKMGADIVIAVHLSPGAYNPGKSQSIFSVMDRSISVMISANELRSMEDADLVISVDLAGFSSTDYASAEGIMARGLEAATRKQQLLSKLTVNDDAWQQDIARRESRRIRSVPAPQFIQVTGVGEPLAHDLQRALMDNIGKPIDTSRLEKDIHVISGIGRFSSFSYHMTELDNKPGLALSADEKQYAPPLLNFGLLIDGADLDNIRWTMNARITALDVGGFRSEWRTDISTGAIWGLSSEYYKPITEDSRWFMAPRISLTSSPFDFYDHSSQVAEYRFRQYGAGFDLGYAIDRFSELRAAYNLGYLRTSISIGAPILPAPRGRIGATSIRYDLDRLDSPIVPRRGEDVQFRTQWTDASPGAPKGFPLSELSFGVIRPISRPGSVYVQAFGGSTFGHRDTGIPQFFLGGPNRLSAYGTNELRTDQYWLVRAGYLHQLFRLPALVGDKVYFTSAYELGKVYGTPYQNGLANDGSVGIVAETFAGPLFIGGSVGDSGHRKVYFALGRFF